MLKNANEALREAMDILSVRKKVVLLQPFLNEKIQK